MEEAKPTPEEAEAARLKELERRNADLGKAIDKAQAEHDRKKPNAPPVGGMIGT